MQIRVAIKVSEINIAYTLNNIGVTYSSKGDNEKAIEHYKKCLGTQVKIKGVDSIDVAKTLNNIRLVYRSQKNFN